MPEGPSMPPAPGLFSTMMGWPRWRPAISASLRRCVSVDPPAGHGTMSVIGRFGKACANTPAGANASRDKATSAIRCATVIFFLLEGLLLFELHVRTGDHLRPLGDLLVQEPRGL